MAAEINIQSAFDGAVRRFIKEDFDRAIDGFSDVIAADPSHALAHISRAAAYSRLERAKEAIRDYDRAIEINPRYTRAFHLRALVHKGEGNLDAALTDLDRAIALDPEYGAAYYSRAAIHEMMGDHERAEEDLRTVAMITEANLEQFAGENNIWRSRHLAVEAEGIADVMTR